MNKTLRNLLIGMALLIILTPIGLIASGTAYGEWDAGTLKDAIGYVPAGLDSLSSLWSAPLSGYGFPGQGDTIGAMTPGYIFSAILGVIVAGGALYVVGKIAIRNE